MNKYFNIKNLLGDRTTTIYRAKDEWGEISVIERRKMRLLTFNSLFVQSSMDIKQPHILVHEYTRAMMLVLAFTNPTHVTLLGLGGGCLLRSLDHILPDCPVHVVELRQQVFDIARDFFCLPIKDNIQITIADAQLALKYAVDESTSIIFADLYQADGMHPLQVQLQFVTRCSQILNDDGWLVLNYHQMPELDSPFFNELCNLFSDIFLCYTESANYVLFASKCKTGNTHRFYHSVEELEIKLETPLVPLFKKLQHLHSKHEDL